MNHGETMGDRRDELSKRLEKKGSKNELITQMRLGIN